jgi:hypothetical protein
MADLFFDIFKNKLDHLSWDKQIEYYSRSNKMLDYRKKNIIKALSYFKVIFSNGFLKSAKDIHPIKSAINNKTNHSTDWLIWLYESLISFERDMVNFNILIEKLGKYQKATQEGVPFIEVVTGLKKSGFKVDFEPKIAGFNKKPDLRITNNKNEEVIYIEVSTVNESDFRNKVMSNYLGLNSYMENKGICYTGRINESISEEDFLKIGPQIDDLIAKCQKEDGLKLLNLIETGNKLELAISKISDVDKLKEWAAGKSLRLYQIQSMDISFSEDLKRITNNKISREAKQVPQNEMGLIYLKVHPMFFMTTNLEETFLKLKEDLMNLNKYWDLFFGLM